MPTKKRRVGFIPRSEVLEIINNLSLKTNLSNSKIINILVEEALQKRGFINNNYVDKINLSNLLNNRNNYQGRISNDNEGIKCDFNNNIDKKNLSREIDNFYLLDIDIYNKFVMFLEFQDKMKNQRT